MNDTSGADRAHWQGMADGLRGNGAARRDAIDKLYQELGARILRRLKAKMNLHQHQAEEVLQEVFIKVIRNADQLAGKEKQLAAWVWQIVRTTGLDWIRRQHSSRVNDHIDVDDPALQLPDSDEHIDPVGTLDESSMRDCVARAYAQFAKKFTQCAEALSWIVTDGMSTAEVAHQLGRTEGATREYLSQCRKKLQPYLARCRHFVTT